MSTRGLMLANDEADALLVRSSSSDSVNTIIHRQRQRQKAGIAAKSNSSKSLGGCLSCGRDSSLILEPYVPSKMDRVVIIGAGAIGSFVGCCLHQAGVAPATILVRNPEHIERYAVTGLVAHSTTDPSFRAVIAPKDVRRLFTLDPACLNEASCILVATKRRDNEEIHRLLCKLRVKCPVVFLQNGMHIRDDLVSTTISRSGENFEVKYEVIEAIIMMDVDINRETGIVTLGQAPKNALIVVDGHQQSAKDVCDLFINSAITVSAERKLHFVSLQAAKVQINMIDAINALTGLTVAETLLEPEYRLVLAHCIDECRAVFAAHRIPLQGVGKEMSNFRLRFMSSFLRAWNFVFLPVMGSKIDCLNFKCTMAHDLDNCIQPTEIEHINGMVVNLGRIAGVPTPINEKIVELVQRAEALQLGSPRLSPQSLMTEVGLASITPVDLIGSDDNTKNMSFGSVLELSSVSDISVSSHQSSLSVRERVQATLAMAMPTAESSVPPLLSANLPRRDWNAKPASLAEPECVDPGAAKTTDTTFGGLQEPSINSTFVASHKSSLSIGKREQTTLAMVMPSSDSSVRPLLSSNRPQREGDLEPTGAAEPKSVTPGATKTTTMSFGGLLEPSTNITAVASHESSLSVEKRGQPMLARAMPSSDSTFQPLISANLPSRDRNAKLACLAVPESVDPGASMTTDMSFGGLQKPSINTRTVASQESSLSIGKRVQTTLAIAMQSSDSSVQPLLLANAPRITTVASHESPPSVEKKVQTILARAMPSSDSTFQSLLSANFLRRDWNAKPACLAEPEYVNPGAAKTKDMSIVGLQKPSINTTTVASHESSLSIGERVQTTLAIAMQSSDSSVQPVLLANAPRRESRAEPACAAEPKSVNPGAAKTPKVSFGGLRETSTNMTHVAGSESSLSIRKRVQTTLAMAIPSFDSSAQPFLPPG